MTFNRFVLLSSFFVGSGFAASIPLKLERSGEGDSTFSEVSGTIEIKGPLGVLATPKKTPGVDFNVLELEYFCVSGLPAFDVLTGPPFGEANSFKLPAMGASEGWITFRTDHRKRKTAPRGLEATPFGASIERGRGYPNSQGSDPQGMAR